MTESLRGTEADCRRADVPCLVPSVVRELQLRISTSRLVAVSLILEISRWLLLQQLHQSEIHLENASKAVVLRGKFVE